MPALSPTMEEGVIAAWNKKEGEAFSAGESICEVETDKATVDFEAQDDGVLAKIIVQAGGSPVPVGTLIGVSVEDTSDVAAFANVTAEDLGEGESRDGGAAKEDKPEAMSQAKPDQQEQQETTPRSSPPSNSSRESKSNQEDGGGRVFASPLARKMMSESGIDPVVIPQGSGPKGRIIKADVEEFLASPQATGAHAQPRSASIGGGTSFVDYEVAQHEQDLAKQLEKSKKEVPHYYLNVEIKLDKLLEVRENLNSQFEEENHISVNDFIMRASAICMKHVPEVNSSWGGSFIRKYFDCDINLAALLGPEDQLLMPVIRKVNMKGLSEIALETRKVVSDSDDTEVDLGLGTFTISNMGAFGLRTFTPIIREPQACSLGIGTIGKRAFPGPPSPETGEPSVSIETTLIATLSCDHRVVDGATGAKWLQHFKSLLENPTNMLL